MFWDWVYSIGGAALVDAMDSVICPIYWWVCDVATITNNDFFNLLATALESILT